MQIYKNMQKKIFCEHEMTVLLLVRGNTFKL